MSLWVCHSTVYTHESVGYIQINPYCTNKTFDRSIKFEYTFCCLWRLLTRNLVQTWNADTLEEFGLATKLKGLDRSWQVVHRTEVSQAQYISIKKTGKIFCHEQTLFFFSMKEQSYSYLLKLGWKLSFSTVLFVGYKEHIESCVAAILSFLFCFVWRKQISRDKGNLSSISIYGNISSIYGNLSSISKYGNLSIHIHMWLSLNPYPYMVISQSIHIW